MSLRHNNYFLLQLKGYCDFSKNEAASTTFEFAVSLFLFLIIALTIAQIAFVLHARLIVQYAASCACRSAVVWIPADLEEKEPINTLPYYESKKDEETSTKMLHIKSAAAMACIPLAPSSLEKSESLPLEIVEKIIQQTFPEGLTSSLPTRLAKKWIMSRILTKVSVSPPESGEQYEPDELIRVSVTHKYYVDIPGPLTFFSSYINITDVVAMPNNGEQTYPNNE